MEHHAAELLKNVRACTLCAKYLPLGPRPVLQVHPEARILIVGQAPGRRVHVTGIPFNDPSGDRLRLWTGLSRETFYDPKQVALLPMGFCYPGTGKSGDLPPRPECAATWRKPLLEHLQNLKLTLIIGQYAHAWHLSHERGTLTDTVKKWRDYAPTLVPLPHPSPRNNLWLRRNPWFDAELVPELQQYVQAALNT